MKLIPKWLKADAEREAFLRTQGERIVSACLSRGYVVSLDHAIAMWREYSEDMGAGWMLLPRGDGEIVGIIHRYAEAVEE